MTRIPQPHELAADVRNLASLWRHLEPALLSRPATSGDVRVKTSPAPPAPGNLDVMEARRLIDVFAFQHAKILDEETTWAPGADTTTPALLEAIALRIGHFTAIDNHVTLEFAAEIERLAENAKAVMESHPERIVPIDIGCKEPGCPGIYGVELHTTDGDEAQRKAMFRMRRPQAICSKNERHTIDAMVVAHAHQGENA